MEIRSAHRYSFPASRDAVWLAVAAVEHYPGWWPWLRQFQAAALAERECWRCTIKPPLPYALRCRIELVEVRAPELVTARLSGDIVGLARIALADGDGRPVTDVTVDSALEARSLPARAAARLFPGVARRAHDWVFDTGARQFAAAQGWDGDEGHGDPPVSGYRR